MSVRKMYLETAEFCGFEAEDSNDLLLVKNRYEGGWWILIRDPDNCFYTTDNHYIISYFAENQFGEFDYPGVPEFESNDLNEALRFWENLK